MHLSRQERGGRLSAMLLALCAVALLCLSSFVGFAQTPETEAEAESTTQAQADTQEEENLQLTLDDVSFNAKVLDRVENYALVRTDDGIELLVPNQQLTAQDQPSNKEEEPLAQSSQEEFVGPAEYSADLNQNTEMAQESEMAQEDQLAEDSQMAEGQMAQDSTMNQSLALGSETQINLNSVQGEIVAVENGLVTLKSGEGALQLPLSAIPQDKQSEIRFDADLVTDNNQSQDQEDNSLMTLAELGERSLVNQEQLQAQQWNGEESAVGILSATMDDGLLIAAPQNEQLTLFVVNPPISAGKAVVMESKQDNVQLTLASPRAEQDNHVAFDQLKVEGEVVESATNALVLSTSEGHNLILPKSFSVKPVNADDQQVDQGDQVAVTIPQGSADVIALRNGIATLQQMDGSLFQVPADQLANLDPSAEQQGLSESAQVASVDELETQGETRGVVVDHGELVVAALVGDDIRLVRVPAADNQNDSGESSLEAGQTVTVSGEGAEEWNLEETTR